MITQVREAVRGLMADQSGRPVGMGIGVAGQVRPTDGLVRFAPNLDWHDVALQKILCEDLDMPVRVINDVKAATLGEWRNGAGRGCDDLICVFVGTGVGGGVISGGRLISGSSGTAGEVGHITVGLHGPLCTCGNQGCLESLAGGWAIARQAQQAAATHPRAGAELIELAGGRIEAIDARAVIHAYRNGNPLAERLIRDVR